MIKSKKDWEAIDQRAFFDEVSRVAASGTADEKRARYAELGFVVENERAPLITTDVQWATWNAVIATLHEAYYGFPPGRLTNAQIMSALSIDEETIRQVSATLDGLLEAMDGASPRQLVSAARKEVRSAGIKIAPRLLARLVAAFEGAPIPPA